MALAQIIPWYDLYTCAVDAVWLTGVILRHASAFSAAVEAACAIKAAEREVPQFDRVVLDNDDDASVATADSADSDKPFSAHLSIGASRFFHTPQLRPKQDMVVDRIVFDPSWGGETASS